MGVRHYNVLGFLCLILSFLFNISLDKRVWVTSLYVYDLLNPIVSDRRGNIQDVQLLEVPETLAVTNVAFTERNVLGRFAILFE